MMNQFKRLYNFYFRVSAIIFGKQSNHNVSAAVMEEVAALIIIPQIRAFIRAGRVI